jgi:hypothetical protein
MATAITENPMASAIVTAQTEIHMIDPMFGSSLNALMGIWFRWRAQISDQSGHERSIAFRDVRVPIA